VKVRGNLAYGHVKQLRDMGLISEEKLGRSKVLRTTPSFSDYFNLSQDSRLMKKQIQKICVVLRPSQPGGTQSAEPKESPEEVPSEPQQEEQNPTASSDPSTAANQ
jgi:hypothetical protein